MSSVPHNRICHTEALGNQDDSTGNARVKGGRTEPYQDLMKAIKDMCDDGRLSGRQRKRPWWARQDSNLRPSRYERPALTN